VESSKTGNTAIKASPTTSRSDTIGCGILKNSGIPEVDFLDRGSDTIGCGILKNFLPQLLLQCLS